jgi:hypothetical protein
MEETAWGGYTKNQRPAQRLLRQLVTRCQILLSCRCRRQKRCKNSSVIKTAAMLDSAPACVSTSLIWEDNAQAHQQRADVGKQQQGQVKAGLARKEKVPHEP